MLRALLISLLAGLTLHAGEVRVFAAASLRDALNEASAVFEQQHDRIKIKFNLAGSNVLALQIQEGAKADLLFTADQAKMDALNQAGLIDPSSRRTLLSNQLVIMVPGESSVPWKSLTELVDSKVKRLALAETETVPAGIYAKQYLQKIGLWSQVQRRVVPLENVRAVLAAVESGNAEAGFVYKTDALMAKRARVAWEIPRTEGPVIGYPIALVKTGQNASEARLFLQFLASPEGWKIFQKYGFLPPPLPSN